MANCIIPLLIFCQNLGQIGPVVQEKTLKNEIFVTRGMVKENDAFADVVRPAPEFNDGLKQICCLYFHFLYARIGFAGKTSYKFLNCVAYNIGSF